MTTSRRTRARPGSERRAYWQQQVEAHRQSGLSQAAFCAQRGLRKGTLGFWRWKLTREDLTASVLASQVIHTDDTVVPVLDRDRTETREGRLWVYVGDGHPADIVYDYTTDRRAGPLAFLRDFRGYLQADAYAGYDALYATGRVVEVACWAHARRYFFDAKASDPARALPALDFIQQLYAVERDVKGADAEIRRAHRVAEAMPVLRRFRQWLDTQADVVLPKSPIGEAVGYARAQWTALTRYCENGVLAIDNNVSERALRKVVTGRANWTFCGSDAGGWRAAILYSVMATCRAHGLDPWAYLCDVLERIPSHPNRRRAKLLPRHWKAAQTAPPHNPPSGSRCHRAPSSFLLSSPRWTPLTGSGVYQTRTSGGTSSR